MLGSDFKQAVEYLSFAFAHCHCSSQNKRLFLTDLLPVKMLLGHMPTMQFAEVTQAPSEGNLLVL